MRNMNHIEVNPFDLGFEMEAVPESWYGERGDEWQGETGRHHRDYVKWVQRSLNTILFPQLSVDGILGTRTRNSILRFQQSVGLAADGIVGSRTEQALVQAGAKQPPSVVAPSQPRPQQYPTPVTPATGQALRSKIIEIANSELVRWGNGQITETDPNIWPTLQDYWRTGVGYLPPDWRTRAWSAAFISWVMRRAGAGHAFKYSGAHTRYVAAAKGNRKEGNRNPFKAYRVTEVSPRPGDLVCRERKNKKGQWSGLTYDNVDDGKFRASHSDIVVRRESGKLFTIGGNVKDRVYLSRKGVSINQNGHITMPRYYAVIRVGA